MKDKFDDLPLHPDVKRYIQAARQVDVDERTTLLRFAPILCRCQPWYDWRNPGAPQEACYVHTSVMLGELGQWL